MSLVFRCRPVNDEMEKNEQMYYNYEIHAY